MTFPEKRESFDDYTNSTLNQEENMLKYKYELQ